MNFSDQWRSLWPVSSVFAAPNLRTSPPPEIPLAFSPSCPAFQLLYSPSLSRPLHLPPHPSVVLESLHSSLTSPSESFFLPSSLQRSFLPDAIVAEDTLINSLYSLRCHDGSTLILFFLVGENAHSIAFLALSFATGAASPQVGPVSVQREGFKHPFHRIYKLAISAAVAETSQGNTERPRIEGFLIAVTMYSANWFRIVMEEGSGEPALLPVAKQSFQKVVAHVCWSPHFQEESVVLLESGELYWFNVDLMSGGVVRLEDDGCSEPKGWLSCEYGGQPWILIVASSTTVLIVDLRSKKGEESRVLVRVNAITSFLNGFYPEETDRILAFCKPMFDNFLISVVTRRWLLLFDMRQPLVPVLSWDHGIKNPSFVAMYKMSELWPCDWHEVSPSQSGFAILAGSFREDDFNLFCFGLGDRGAIYYAWELPSPLSVSGRKKDRADELVRDLFMKQKLCGGVVQQGRSDLVVGFCILPQEMVKHESNSVPSSGFTLVRLMFTGNLEIQKYGASSCSSDKISGSSKEAYPFESKDSIENHEGQPEKSSVRFQYLKLRCFTGYMNGRLRNELLKHFPPYTNNANDRICTRKDRINPVKDAQPCSSPPLLEVLCDSCIPRSIFEIAGRRILSSLSLQVQTLTFSKYSDLSRNYGNLCFELSEMPRCLPQSKRPHFFLRKPSNRSMKYSSRKVVFPDNVVGPLLPLPVLLAFQQMSTEIRSISDSSKVNSGHCLSHECKMVHEVIYPEISMANSGPCTGSFGSQEFHNNQSFFTYEPKFVFKSSSKTKASESLVSHGNPSVNDNDDDDFFSNFVVSTSESTCDSKPVEEVSKSLSFNLGPVKLVFDQPCKSFLPDELMVYKCFKRNFSDWMQNYKPYHEFCSSSKIPKLDNDNDLLI